MLNYKTIMKINSAPFALPSSPNKDDKSVRKRIEDALRTQGERTRKQVADYLGISDAVAHGKMSDMEAKGEIQKAGRVPGGGNRKAYTYKLPEVEQ